MPLVYLPHGGGPWPFMDPIVPAGSYDGLATYLRRLPGVVSGTPEAILVVSAHWEEPTVSVMSSSTPPMFYDYTGFPPSTYQVRWPAPGAPVVADRARELLGRRGIPSVEDAQRGFDHGVFVPLSLAWPAAEVPTLQVSLKRGLDPAEHLAIGRALAPLRDEGVLLIGSGMSYHNMRGFFGGVPTIREDSAAFDGWLAETVAMPAAEREERLIAWTAAPRARACHPREEHLLPLMVVAGAAEGDQGSTPFRDEVLGAVVSAVHFG